MKMDNSDFKRKAVETTGLFGKLTNSLNKIPGINLGKTTQELGAINEQANNMNMNGMNSALQTISNRFTTMGVIATTVLTNITNRAFNAGVALTKSLTLDQVTSGFQEYELKMGSIQTMLANTEWAGSDLEDVQKVLGDLNEYADETIYNFAQMTQNIGRFTAAGVGLEDSAIAIKGLSNLAAVSGSDVNQLNTAMYQMSQSMAAGYFNLMDWNSLVNAGMGGKKLQDELLKTAEAMGVTVDMSEGFRQSISDGWLTSEIFLETMKKFGKDKSMTEAATSVRTLSTLMDSLKEGIGSGWATTWEHIFGDFNEATKFWTDLSETVNDFFDSSADARNKFVKGVADGGGFLNIFEGIGNAVKPIVQIFKALGDGFRRVFPPASVERVIELTERFKDFTAGLTISSETMGKLTTIFQGAFSIFSTVWEIVKRLGGAIVQIIPEGTGAGILSFLENIAEMAISFNESVKEGNALTDMIDGLGSILGDIGRVVKEALSSIVDFGASFKENISSIVDWIADKLRPVGQFFKEAFGGFGGDELVGTGLLVGIGAVVTKIVGFFNNAGQIVASVRDVFEGVGDAVNAFAMGIKVTNLLLIATAIGILALSLGRLEGINADDLTRGLSSLAVALGVMISGMLVMDKFNVTGGLRAAITIIGLATAVSIMASALKKISDLRPDELKTGIAGLVGVTAALAAAIVAMSKWGGKIGASSLQLIALAGSIYIITAAVKQLTSIKSDDLWKSIAALGVIFAEIAVFLKVANGAKLGVGSALGIVIVAGALHVMISAIKKIEAIDVKSLVKGLSTIAIILAEIAAFSKLVGGPSLLAAGAGMLLVAGAMAALIIPIKTLGDMDWESLIKGLGAMAVALGAVAGAAILMRGTIGASASLILMATGLTALLIPIKVFSKMTWGEMVKGFVGLAGGLAAIAGVSLLLSPATVPMLAFSAAVLALGAAVVAVGAGIALFSVGLGLLATMTAGSIAAIVSSLSLLIQGFTSLIPAALRFIVELGSALLDGFAELAPKLINTVLDVLIQLLGAIEGKLPDFIDKGVGIIIGLMEGIGRNAPELVSKGVELIIDLILGMAKALEENGDRMIDAFMALMGELIILVINAGVEVIEALFGWIPGVTGALENVSETAEDTVREHFGVAEVAKMKGEEFAKALEDNAKPVHEAGEFVGTTVVEGMEKAYDDVETLGSQFVNGLWKGMEQAQPHLYSNTNILGMHVKKQMEETWGIRSPSRVAMGIGRYFTEGLAVGIMDRARRVTDNAKSLAVTAKDSLNKFLTGFDSNIGDNELHFKAIIDYDGALPRDLYIPVVPQPDTRLTSGLVASTKSEIRQNDDNVRRKDAWDKPITNDNTYNINVTAGGTMTRSQIRKLAEDIQTEIKNVNDRGKISRGEGVAF